MALFAESVGTFCHATRHCVGKFQRDERGGLIVFSLLVLISMLVLGGMAVDFMRQENQRVVLQGVADRSVLSAASLQQTINGRDIVNDYFDTSGVNASLLEDPYFEDEGNSKRVSVRAEQELDTFFLRLIGIDTLSSIASANAIEATGKVEISLVIDVTASMANGGSGGTIRNNPESLANGGRIGDLRNAARAFAEAVLDPIYEGQVSLNIVPYGGHTNPGKEMYNRLHGITDLNADIGIPFYVPFDTIIPGDQNPLFTIIRNPNPDPTSTLADEFALVVNSAVDRKGVDEGGVNVTDVYAINKDDPASIQYLIDNNIYPDDVLPVGYIYAGATTLRYSTGAPVVVDGVTVTNEMITAILREERDPITNEVIVDGSGEVQYESAAEKLPLEAGLPAGLESENVVLLAATGSTPAVRYLPPASCMEIRDAANWTSLEPPLPGEGFIPNYMIYGFGDWQITEGARNWGWCPQNETTIKYALQEADDAVDYINGLSLYDGTGTDMAMKWGFATLDPAMQPHFAALNAHDNRLVPDDFVNRPAAYDDVETRKIIVLMTDGQVTGQWRAQQPENLRNLIDVTPGTNPTPANWLGWTAGTAANGGRTSVKSANDARRDLVELCKLAHDESRDIKVFTVAFEYPSDGSFADNVQAMKDCATQVDSAAPDDEQYYFETSGAGLTEVFEEIAQSISKLRLTE